MVTLAGQALLKRWDHDRAQKHADKDEQRKLARKMLRKVEHFCTELELRRAADPNKEWGPYEDPLNRLREEISCDALELSDKKARKEMEKVDTAMLYALDPTVKLYPGKLPNQSTVAAQMAARKLLGAIVRGETVPEIHGLEDILSAAMKVEDFLVVSLTHRAKADDGSAGT